MHVIHYCIVLDDYNCKVPTQIVYNLTKPRQNVMVDKTGTELTRIAE